MLSFDGGGEPTAQNNTESHAPKIGLNLCMFFFWQNFDIFQQINWENFGIFFFQV
jgi:hypothetical protein